VTVYLGVDGGGSKTAALAIDERGNLLGVGHSGGSNHQVIGLEVAVQHIREAAAQALNGQRAAVGAFCLSGADMRYDFSLLEPAISGLDLCDQPFVYTDSLAIVRAGSSRPYGSGVVCGTGFNAVGVSRTGEEFRLPSLGEITGDRVAGGYALGMNALGAAFRAWDGRGEPTWLSGAVLETLQAPDFPTLAEQIVQGQISHAQVLALTPLIFTGALHNDQVACRLIRDLGEEVGVTIRAFLRRMNLLETPCDAVLGGSVFYGDGPLLLETIRAAVCPVAPLVQLKRLDVKPVVGAALLALDRAGIPFDDLQLRSHLPADLTLFEGR